VIATDPIRQRARDAIAQLRALRLEVAMISGDNERTATAVDAQLGIDRLFAQVLPQDKADHIRRLQGEGKKVARVGDGINEAPRARPGQHRDRHRRLAPTPQSRPRT
jgi:P-type E1-E2 ATPase